MVPKIPISIQFLETLEKSAGDPNIYIASNTIIIIIPIIIVLSAFYFYLLNSIDYLIYCMRLSLKITLTLGFLIGVVCYVCSFYAMGAGTKMLLLLVSAIISTWVLHYEFKLYEDVKL